jgi:hypothetical protein
LTGEDSKVEEENRGFDYSDTGHEEDLPEKDVL